MNLILTKQIVKIYNVYSNSIKTKNLKQKINGADIVVLATGNANFMCADDFSDNTVIIDVSINFDDNGKMCGDVIKSDYDKLIEKNCNISPVPGGVGPMTIAMLMQNTLTAAKLKAGLI